MPAYDSAAYRPPAPVAVVTVRLLNGVASVTGVPMLIDSGADVSLLPRDIIATLIDPSQESAQYELKGFDGTKSLVPAVQLEMQYLGKSFRGQFLIVNSPQGILGRNVLNSVSILLDGPMLTWSEHGKQ